MALNKVMLIGNVGGDPEIRYLDSNPQGPQGNTKVATFRLATTERYRDRNGETRENTEWHNIVAWRNSADLAERYIHKGTQVYIEGRLRTRKWTDRDGRDRYTTEIQVDNIQLLGRRPDNQEGNSQQASSGQPTYGMQGPAAPAPAQSPVQGSPAPIQPQGVPAGAPTAVQPVPPQAPVTEMPPAPLEQAEEGDDLPF